jgi:hypothetical protein
MAEMKVPAETPSDPQPLIGADAIASALQITPQQPKSMLYPCARASRS